MKSTLLLTWCILATTLYAQTKWYNPLDSKHPVIQGQGWQCEERENPYHRFPIRFKEKVRPAVWNLSRNTAGRSIEFTTDAPEIKVRYLVSGGLSMPHMPATGVSGIDLYSTDINGKEVWAGGRYNFADTITYSFGKLTFDGRQKGAKYTLFLPPYNTVTWMEIGVPQESKFDFDTLRGELPIVAYGTSITQGACASRPGTIWTNMLQRRMDREVMNIGFSGNAYFEKNIIDILGEIEAKIYILDGLPNSHSLQKKELKDTIVSAVKQLRKLRPNTPILLADHLGYPHGSALGYWKKQETHANQTQKEAYEQLLSEGIEKIYHLTYDEIGMPQDATVEGIHPSDWGMAIYANAYEKKLRQILNEKTGELETMQPVRQSRDFYNWNDRHNQILTNNGLNKPKHYSTVLIGNSIIHQWGGIDGFAYQSGKNVWDKHLNGALNLGFGWDKIENVLWRVYHDELESFTADNIKILIGTNNLSTGSTDSEVTSGLRLLIQAIKQRRPESKITIMGILPRREMENRIYKLNKKIKKLAKEENILYADPGKELLQKRDKIDETLFRDGLHPNENGYSKIVNVFL